MSAIISACQKSASIKNTGVECHDSMGPTAMLFAIPPGATWLASDLADFNTFLIGKCHAAKAQRFYPLFGPSVPIRKITNNKEADVVQVMDDGTRIFIRYGVITRQFSTTDGGICYAQVLQSLNKAGYSIIEVDIATQLLFRVNPDGTYSALRTTFMYSPSPDAADFKNAALTNFEVSYKPEEFVGFGKIFQADDASILDITGLLDVLLSVGAAGASSTTKLKFQIASECAGTDLVASLGAAWSNTANFVVKKKSDGTTPTVTAAAIVNGHMELTGTFVTATVYTVQLAAASVLLTNDIMGYEGANTLEITIP